MDPHFLQWKCFIPTVPAQSQAGPLFTVIYDVNIIIFSIKMQKKLRKLSIHIIVLIYNYSETCRTLTIQQILPANLLTYKTYEAFSVRELPLLTRISAIVPQWGLCPLIRIIGSHSLH